MSDNQFMLLFWLLLFSVGELFIIGVLIYGIIKGLSVWQVSWNEWRDNDQARKAQTEAIESKLNDILSELKLPTKLQREPEGKLRESKTDNDARVQEDMETAMKIKAICELGRMHSREIHVKSLAPEVLARAQKAYEDCKHDAIVLVRQLRDGASRDFALNLIVNLCMDGEDETEAKKLFDAIEADVIKDDILAKYPQLFLRRIRNEKALPPAKPPA